MFNPHIGAIYLQKIQKIFGKVIIWMDFVVFTFLPNFNTRICIILKFLLNFAASISLKRVGYE